MHKKSEPSEWGSACDPPGDGCGKILEQFALASPFPWHYGRLPPRTRVSRLPPA